MQVPQSSKVSTLTAESAFLKSGRRKSQRLSTYGGEGKKGNDGKLDKEHITGVQHLKGCKSSLGTRHKTTQITLFNLNLFKAPVFASTDYSGDNFHSTPLTAILKIKPKTKIYKTECSWEAIAFLEAALRFSVVKLKLV